MLTPGLKHSFRQIWERVIMEIIERITNVNDDLFSYKKLGAMEEIWYKSSADGLDINGWIVTPPDFDPTKKYPLILEIHGGPFL